MAGKPKLKPYDVDLSQYDEVIIGFPIWASNITPPVRTFVCDNLEELKDKKIAVYSCQSGNGAERAFAKLKDLLGIEEYVAKAVFIDPKSRPSDDNDRKLEDSQATGIPAACLSLTFSSHKPSRHKQGIHTLTGTAPSTYDRIP